MKSMFRDRTIILDVGWARVIQQGSAEAIVFALAHLLFRL